MNRSGAVLTVLALLAVVVLAACGADDSGGSSTADKAAATSSTQVASAPAQTTTGDVPAAGIDTDNTATRVSCQKSFKPFLVKLRKIQASIDGTPRFRPFGTSVIELASGLQGFDPQSESNNCQTTVGRFAGAAFVQFASATGTWATCPALSKCSAAAKAFIKARLEVGSTNSAQARIGVSTIPKSGT